MGRNCRRDSNIPQRCDVLFYLVLKHAIRTCFFSRMSRCRFRGHTGRRGRSCSEVVQDRSSHFAGLLQRDPEAIRRYADFERETSRSRRGELIRNIVRKLHVVLRSSVPAQSKCFVVVSVRLEMENGCLTWSLETSGRKT